MPSCWLTASSTRASLSCKSKLGHCTGCSTGARPATVGGELLAEVALLRGQLAEANRSKAVLAGKLQQARADCAAMGARLAAGQARHAADLAHSAAAAEEANAALRREAGALRAENQRLLAQAQLLARAAVAAGESERGAALAGIVRQREEQLTAAHLEVAWLQVCRWQGGT